MAYYRGTKIFETLNGFATSDQAIRVIRGASIEEAKRKAISFRNSIRWHKIKDVSVVRKKDLIILLNLCGYGL